MGTLKIYLDNCCYNRPFDNQAQMKIRLETEAERFISMVSRDKSDYTEWRRNNLCNGMTIDEIYDKAAAAAN